MTLSAPTPHAKKHRPGALRLVREPLEGPSEDVDARRANARVTEFIAKPGRTEELRAHICQSVTPLLREQSEFISTIVLTSDEEPRRVVAITFWCPEEPACGVWEQNSLVRETLSPLVDVWPRGGTYKVDLTETIEIDDEAMSLVAC